MAIGTSLPKAYANNTIPSEGGFIITAFFDSNSFYAIYEVTAYQNVKDIYRSPEGITFKTDGNRTHTLIEPATYIHKYIEPVNRDMGKSVPYRFNEMEVYNCAKSEKVMVPLEPVMLYTNFTILEKKADYLSFIFHPTSDVYLAMQRFLADSYYNDCNLQKRDAVNAAALTMKTVKKFTIWQS
jgi:hypothetical protein